MASRRLQFRRLRCVERLSRFEPKALKAAVAAWQRWLDWAAVVGLDPWSDEAQQSETVGKFVAATASRAPMAAQALWSALWFAVKHLKAPMFLNPATRPRWQAGEGGAVQEPEQAAVCEPEMLVRLEAALNIMRFEEQAAAAVLQQVRPTPAAGLEKEVKAAAGKRRFNVFGLGETLASASAFTL